MPGRRLGEIGAADLPQIRAGIEADATLSSEDRDALLDMVGKIERAQATTDHLMSHGRRRMRDEMAAHREGLELDFEKHVANHRRGLQTTESTQSRTCSEQHPPISLDHATIRLSLPLKAVIELSDTNGGAAP